MTESSTRLLQKHHAGKPKQVLKAVLSFTPPRRNRINSAFAGLVVQKLGDDLDLIVSNQSRRMTAIPNGVNAHIAIPARHFPENAFGKQIRVLATYHQNGDVDGVPV